MIALATRLMSYEEDTISDAPCDPGKDSTCSDQLDQLAKNQDWRQDHRDLEQHSKYTMDPRHPHHINLHYSGCGDEECRTHLQGKNDTDYYSRPMIRCRSNYWNKYTDNICPVHLINKRYYQYFSKKSYFRTNH